MGKATATHGALSYIAAIANKLVKKGEKLATEEINSLLSYLRNEGRDQRLVYTEPGSTLPVSITRPEHSEIWWRGGNNDLKLQEPVFLTRNKAVAADYATENGKLSGVGAVGSYKVMPENEATIRDLYRIGLENGIVGRQKRLTQNPSNMPFATNSVLDWTYDKNMREALRADGYDSVLGIEPWDSNVVSLVALDKSIIEPVDRRIVAYGGNHDIFSRYPDKRKTPFIGDFFQFGEVTPWTKKAKGGLVQYSKECGCHG